MGCCWRLACIGCFWCRVGVVVVCTCLARFVDRVGVFCVFWVVYGVCVGDFYRDCLGAQCLVWYCWVVCCVCFDVCLVG